jgi:hypothetical protein
MLSKCKTLNPNPSTSPSTPKDKVQHLGLGYSSVGDVCSVCMRTCWIQSLEWKINNSHWNFLTDCFLLGLSPGSPTPAFFFFSPFAWRTLYTLKIHVHFLFPFFFFFSSGDWTQGLSFPLEPCPSPFFFLVGMRSLGLHSCKAGTLVLEPHLQSILFWLFWRWDLMNICLGWPITVILLISTSQV